MNPIIFPTDFTDQNDPALRFASEVAKRDGCKLIITHVKPPAAPPVASLAPAVYGIATPGAASNWYRAAAEGQERAAIAERLDAVAPTEVIDCEHVLRVGEAADEILRLAEETHASRIVMGTHGRQGFQRVVMGSVAEKVVREAPCPVTVIRNEAREPQEALSQEAQPLEVQPLEAE
ncbi:universal stress protein [Pseudobythopirellula maris]|nr:universal stress protein [Pseudobythopirellula maris]